MYEPTVFLSFTSIQTQQLSHFQLREFGNSLGEKTVI